MAAQSASTQQLPLTQMPVQQKSLPFAAQAPLAEQTELTHWPEDGIPLVVLQMVDEP